MTVDELGEKELKLYSKVISIESTIEEKINKIRDQGIFDEYRKIHQEYARLNKKDLEALKRGLFLIWYSMAEPSFLTGIDGLDAEAEETIFRKLEAALRKGESDYELDWMLSYYANWDYVFEKYKAILDSIRSKPKVERPEIIDKSAMLKRGQMGIYWNSIFQ